MILFIDGEQTLSIDWFNLNIPNYLTIGIWAFQNNGSVNVFKFEFEVFVFQCLYTHL